MHLSLSAQLDGYRLTLAEILYHMPDHPQILQTFIWQDLDMAPRFPRLNKFLSFWHANLDGKLYAVRVASSGILSASEMRYAQGEWTVN